MSALIAVATQGYCAENAAKPIAQQEISRVSQMSAIPKKLKNN